jgi:hypothetical protein
MMEEQKRMLKKFPNLPGELSSIDRRFEENQKYINTLRTLLLSNGKKHVDQKLIASGVSTPVGGIPDKVLKPLFANTKLRLL